MQAKHIGKILTVQGCNYTRDRYAVLSTFLYTWQFSWKEFGSYKKRANLRVFLMLK